MYSSLFRARSSLRHCLHARIAPRPSLSVTAFHSTARRLAKDKKGKQKEVAPSGRPRNRDIPHRVVRLVNPVTSQLDPPVALSDILATVDPKKQELVLVAENPEPLVKIIDKGAEYRKKAAQKRKMLQNRREEKEIQMTWGIASTDLAHKLQKVRDELERGNRVNLVYAPKKGQAQPTPEEMRARVQETLDLLDEVGNDWKPSEISKTTAILYLEGRTRRASLPVREVPKSVEIKMERLARDEKRKQKQEAAVLKNLPEPMDL